MGRYYDGDIEGKFWFGVQSSDAPERFGCEDCTSRIRYYADDLTRAKTEVSQIEKALGDWVKKFDDFFDKVSSYNDEMLIKAGFPKSKVTNLLKEYADLLLGRKIVACLKDNGYCEFEADL